MNDFRVQASFHLLADSVADGQTESPDMLTTRARGYTCDASRPSGLASTLTDRCLHTETLAPRRSGRVPWIVQSPQGLAMALWKDTNIGTVPASTTPGVASAPAPAHAREPEKTNVASLSPEPARRPAQAATAQRHDIKESYMSSDLTIEGKIVGTGHIRIAGRFKGDVQVDGNVSLDTGARLEGQVKAHVVSVGGELIGNIENAKRVDLLETGVINGDVKAGSLTVAAGSRMRGQVEFGYEGETQTRTKSDTKGFGNA